MEIKIGIAIVLCLVIFCIIMGIWVGLRNELTCKFRITIIKKIGNYNERRIKEGTYLMSPDNDNMYKKYLYKYSYNKMMFSIFKRLKLESWFTEEEIKELNR